MEEEAGRRQPGGGDPGPDRRRKSGILVDAHDLAGVADGVRSLLADPEHSRELGEAGRQQVADRFLVTGRLVVYFRLFEALIRAAG